MKEDAAPAGLPGMVSTLNPGLAPRAFGFGRFAADPVLSQGTHNYQCGRIGQASKLRTDRAARYASNSRILRKEMAATRPDQKAQGVSPG